MFLFTRAFGVRGDGYERQRGPPHSFEPGRGAYSEATRSPSGHVIHFKYDAAKRIAEASDDSGTTRG
jgi:hypothetical protein